jgi:hypothetical protein
MFSEDPKYMSILIFIMVVPLLRANALKTMISDYPEVSF